MNEKLNECIKLAEETERYHFRQTPDRQSRRKEKENRDKKSSLTPVLEVIDESDLDLPEIDDDTEDEDQQDLVKRFYKLLGKEKPLSTPVPSPVNSPENRTRSPSPQVSPPRTLASRLIMATTAVVTNAARFVGTVSSTEVDKKRKEKYDVEQYLADVDSRITANRITVEADKIKEALLLVDPEVGDAHALMTSTLFTQISTYEDFKIKCRKIWKPKAYRDKFYNLSQLRTLKKKGTTDFNYMAEVRTVIDRVVTDIKGNKKIKRIEGGKRDEMADITEIVTYIAFSTIYDSLSEDFQRAFKKLELDPTTDLIDLMNNIMEKANENRIKHEVVAYTEDQNPSRTNKVESTLVTQHSKNSQAKRGNYQRGRGVQSRGQNSHNQGNSYQGYSQPGYQQQSYNQRGRGSYRQYRGRGYHNQGYREGPKCRKCGRTNHKTYECFYCDYCKEYGHETSRCYKRQGNEKRPNRQNEENEN